MIRRGFAYWSSLAGFVVGGWLVWSAWYHLPPRYEYVGTSEVHVRVHPIPPARIVTSSERRT